MSGRVGRSGRPRKPITELLASGTYRADRHAGRLAAFQASREAVATFPVPTSPPPVPEDVLAGLDDAGRRYVEDLWTAYAFGPANVRLLHELGRQADRLARARAELVDQPLLVKNSRGERVPHPLLRVERQAVGMLAGLLKQLDLETEK